MVLPGFNTDFKYKGQVYHAQTEDNGVANPVVITLLYLKGAILASKKTSYQELLERENCRDEVMNLMKNQHREIMREVLAGTYDTPAEPQAAASAPPVAEPAPAQGGAAPEAGPKSLDDAIMEYLAASAAGKTPGA